jgi:hypothetical protein
MSLITVYAYRVYNGRTDEMELSNVFATKEFIELMGYQIESADTRQIDSSTLNERGVFHPPLSTK